MTSDEGVAGAARPEGIPSGAAAGDAAALASRLQALQHESDMLVGRISHELQSVLQNMEGFAAALQAGTAGRLQPKEQHYLDRIRHHAMRGNSLLHDLLGFYRLATAPLEPVSLDLRRAVERACRRVEVPDARAVEWTLSGEWSCVHADAGLVEHALMHLLANAVKFSPERTPAVVEITAVAGNGMCELRITDHGIGFAPADADRLFQPCVRLHGDAFGGSGMGLAAVRRIAERHGGRVAASGTPGLGATFTFALPLAAAALAPARAPAAGAARPRRVLLIDDDPLVLASVGAMLERAGCEVTPAGGGQAGLAAFEGSLRGVAFDAVITDWGMPQVGGQHVARAVKMMRPATAVLIVTGQLPETVRRELPEVDAVLGKPLRSATLKSALDQFAPAAV